MRYIMVDFETRSEANLSSTGAWKYAIDPTTEILCMAYKIDDNETKVKDFREGYEIPADFLEAVEDGAKIEAFNVSFEFAIYSNILSGLHNWPRLNASMFLCTQARAAQFSLPRSLESVTRELKLSSKKDLEGRKIMLQMCKPKKITKKNPNKWYNDDDRYMKLIDYCKQDVDATYAVKCKLLELTKEKNYFLSRVTKYKSKELDIFHLNNKINNLGILTDVKSAQTAIKIVNEYTEELNNELSDITEGEIKTSGQTKALVEYFNNNGIHIPDMRSETVTSWIPRLEGKFKRILEIRQALAQSSIKKFYAIIEMADSEGVVRDNIVYYGANRTGRFAAKGLQVHNIIKPFLDDESIELAFELFKKETNLSEFKKVYPEVFKALSSCVRGMIIPRPGHVFLDSDFSAIEARVLFWLANDADGLAMYYAKQDIYKEMAATIYNKKIDDITKGDRQLGKTAILGCGYGMGVERFIVTCKNNDINVDEELASKAVYSYRDRFFSVTDLWNDLEEAMVRSILNPGKIFHIDKVSFFTYNRNTYISLPSGRALFYKETKAVHKFMNKFKISYMGYNSQIHKFEEQQTFGGKICENCVQAIARDFMAEAMLRIDNLYPIVFTVHDQVICEVKEKDADIEKFNMLMTTLPEWGSGCPIEAETIIAKRFKK